MLHLGLGWLGLLTGFHFQLRSLDALPRGTFRIVSLSTALPAALVMLCSFCFMYLAQGNASVLIVWRDAAALGVAGAMGAPMARHILKANRIPSKQINFLQDIYRLDDVACIVGLAFLGAYFRPRLVKVAWQLPGTAWLLITLGLGMTVGVVIYVMLRRKLSHAELTTVILGCVAFSSGMAAYLALSPLVLSFIVGVLLTNLPGAYKARVVTTLSSLERPIYLLFLFVVGAHWNSAEAYGWWLLPIFVVARVVARFLSTRLSLRTELGHLIRGNELGFVAAPMGALAVATIVSVQIFYHSEHITWMVTAVVGGAVISELSAQGLLRYGIRFVRRKHETSAKLSKESSA
ncbi:MAG: hypothetical protein IPJ88_09595 [Myxococcales bacterium]|nr:MAG: hypothetical protein IPJ88_09595 [Myxococcales bacterium]